MNHPTKFRQTALSPVDALSSAASQTIGRAVADALKEYQGAGAGRSPGIAGAVKEVFADIVSDERASIEALVASHLQSHERMSACEKAQQRMPLVLRLLPFLPDVLKRPKSFLLAVTSQRVLALRVHRSLWLNRFKKVEVALSLSREQVQAIEVASEVHSSVAVIRTRNGGSHRYTDLTTSAADRLANALH